MLNEEQYRVLNDQIQSCRREIEAHGLTVESRGDPAAFVSARQMFQGYAHPAFDPAAGAEAGPGEFFWLAVKDGGEIAGVIASRMFTGSMTDLLHRRRFWGFDHPSIDDIAPFPIAARRDVAQIRGVVSYQGGLVLRRKLIRLAVANPLLRLIRLASFRHWAEDWQCAFYLKRTDPHGRRFREWGYPHQATLFEGSAGPGPKASHQREELAYVSGREILESLSVDNIVDFARPQSMPVSRADWGLSAQQGHRYTPQADHVVAPVQSLQ